MLVQEVWSLASGLAAVLDEQELLSPLVEVGSALMVLMDQLLACPA